jgi:hypothetical protein
VAEPTRFLSFRGGFGPVGRRASRSVAVLAAACGVATGGGLVGGCGNDAPQSTDPGTPAVSATASSAVEVVAPVPQPTRPAAANPNPLGLPARDLDLAPGTRVFAVPEPMLRGAKLGSTFVLHAARVVGRDGESLLVQTREGEPYKLHPGYVVPVPGGTRRPGIGQPVIAEWAGVLKHGVFRAIKKERSVVRFFDASDTADRALADAILFRAEDGFRPGNYAAARIAGELRQVLLVSPIEGESKRWLALAHAGAATLIEETDLTAIPVKWEPKEGAEVRAESLGRMRPGTVQSVDAPGLYTIKLERAGRPITVGWGSIMPPLRTGPRAP